MSFRCWVTDTAAHNRCFCSQSLRHNSLTAHVITFFSERIPPLLAPSARHCLDEAFSLQRGVVVRKLGSHFDCVWFRGTCFNKQGHFPPSGINLGKINFLCKTAPNINFFQFERLYEYFFYHGALPAYTETTLMHKTSSQGNHHVGTPWNFLQMSAARRVFTSMNISSIFRWARRRFRVNFFSVSHKSCAC